MTNQEFLMPKMGESITEATILSWSKSVGDTIQEDETLLEIATDKVDSELPSPFAGKVVELLFKEGDVVEVGAPIAIIVTDQPHGQNTGNKAPTKSVATPSPSTPQPTSKPTTSKAPNANTINQSVKASSKRPQGGNVEKAARPSMSKRFYSPLVRAIAEAESLGIDELDTVIGTGGQGRVTKGDVVEYVQHREAIVDKSQINYVPIAQKKKATSYSGDVEIVEMTRTRRLIADHMVRSKQTSPHVTSFVEIDISNVYDWRTRVKADFMEKHGEKLTFTPIFVEAVSKAIADFPDINASVDGHQIIMKRYINIGMATATPSGNLIVPVIKNADHFDLPGLAGAVNDLAVRARSGKLKPTEIQDGTFTLTNVGTFGNTMGTPIINQPQVAILSTGSIKKKPAVIETENGDEIVVRRFMFLSLSYDHRIVDGALGGQFLRRVGDYLEGFDMDREV